MTAFTWKLIDVTCDGEQITHVKYQVTAQDGENIVKTEGNAYADFSFGIPYKDICEQNVIDTLKNLYTQNNVNLIESNLIAQIEKLKKQPVLPPWHVETFKLEV